MKYEIAPNVSCYPIPADWRARAYVDAQGYAEMFHRSIEEPEAFWPELVWGFLCQANFIMRVPDFVGAQSRP
jgi:hypothetical protein